MDNFKNSVFLLFLLTNIPLLLAVEAIKSPSWFDRVKEIGRGRHKTMSVSLAPIISVPRCQLPVSLSKLKPRDDVMRQKPSHWLTTVKPSAIVAHMKPCIVQHEQQKNIAIAQSDPDKVDYKHMDEVPHVCVNQEKDGAASSKPQEKTDDESELHRFDKFPSESTSYRLHVLASDPSDLDNTEMLRHDLSHYSTFYNARLKYVTGDVIKRRRKNTV